MKKVFLVLVAMALQSSAFADSASYHCQFVVRSSQANLEVEFEFDGRNSIQTRLERYSFTVNTTENRLGETIVVGIGHPGGASGAIAQLGQSSVAAVYRPAASPSDVVQALCELQ